MASTEMAAPCVSVQAKLNSIMEMLAKAAVAEIGKLWEDGFVLVQAELQRKDGEIEALNRKILAMESEKLKAQSKNLTSASSQTTPKRKMLPLNGDGPVITSVQSLASEPIVCNKPETSADHNTPPPPPRHEKLRKTTQKQANSIKEADLAVKMEEEDDVQIVEPIQTEMDEATQCAEAKDEESQEVCVGNNDGDCLVNSKLLLQNLDSEILLILNTLDILESSTERTQTDRRIKDNSMLQGTPSNPRATGSISQHNEAIHSNGPVTVCTNSEKPPQIYNSLNPDRSFMFNNSNVNKKRKSFRIREKWFICSFCGKSFDRISHLEMHQRIHTGEKPYKCDICGKCFSQRGNQQKHQSTHKDSC